MDIETQTALFQFHKDNQFSRHTRPSEFLKKLGLEDL